MTKNPQGKPIKPKFPVARRDQPLRNLVSSLLAQESVETTLSRALAISKYAERCITWGKTGQKSRLNSFLYNPVKIPNAPHPDPVPNYFLREQPVATGPPMPQDSPIKKTLSVFKERYRKRQGGYTRVLRLPNRKKDNAKMAVVEMVDNPREIQFAMLAKIVAREMVDAAVSPALRSQKKVALSSRTAERAAKALRYKTDEQRREWDDRVQLHAVSRISFVEVIAQWLIFLDFTSGGTNKNSFWYG